MNCHHSQYLYSSTPVPHFNALPYQVFSTPGLGNFCNDHTLFTPLLYVGQNVKEVEKEIDESPSGGFELNAPLIVKPLVAKKSKRKDHKKKPSKVQKGDGEIDTTDPSDKEIDEAMQHPIKVVR